MSSLKGMRTEEDVDFDRGVGEAIRRQREAKGMSQTEMARLAGVTFQQVQKYEKGVNRVAASRLNAISKALGVSMSVLLGEKEAEPTAARPDLSRLAQAYLLCDERRQRVLLDLARLFADRPR